MTYAKRLVFFMFAVFASMLLAQGCRSTPPLAKGIQRGYEALNPAAILAVPIFVLPDPSSEKSSLDTSLLTTERLLPKFEKKIIDSFANQPNINGYPFTVVRQALGTPSPIWNDLNNTMKQVAGRFSSRDVKVRVLISPQCLARKNFLEFYVYCLQDEHAWVSSLNALSSKVLHADAALITVVTHLQDRKIDKSYEIQGGLALLLVDTNNGRLIWGNTQTKVLRNEPPGEQGGPSPTFPRWDRFLNETLTPAFWAGFPGRIGQNQIHQNEWD